MLVLAIIGAVAAIPALAMHVMGGIGLDYYDYYNVSIISRNQIELLKCHRAVGLCLNPSTGR